MGLFSRLFGTKASIKKSHDESDKNTGEIARVVSLAKEYREKANTCIQEAAKHDDDYVFQSQKLTRGMYYLNILKWIGREYSFITLTNLADLDRDISKFWSFIQNERKAELQSIAMTLGEMAPICPSCKVQLPKLPKRKIMCKACKMAIYPRNLPFSGRPVLLSEAQYPLLEEMERMASDGWLYWWESESWLSEIKRELSEEWKIKDPRIISDGDAHWRIADMKTTDSLKVGDWSGYRDTKLSMINQLIKENRTQDAFSTLCEFIYLSYSSDSPSYGICGYHWVRLFNSGISDREFAQITPAIPEHDTFHDDYIRFIEQSALPVIFGDSIEETYTKYKMGWSKYVPEPSQRGI